MARKKPATAPEPMDPGAPETRNADFEKAAPRSERNCYALNTLVAEVTDLFPETSHEVSNRTKRWVALDVTFTGYDTNHGDVEPTLPELLGLLDSEPRVAAVLHDSEQGQVLVSFVANPHLMDSRAPFGLRGAYEVITEENQR